MTSKKRFVLVGTVFTAAVLMVATVARTQPMGAPAPFGPHPVAKPGSSVVELCPPIHASVSNITGVAPVPLGTQVRVDARLVAVLKVMTAAAGANLDVYFQHSSDDGQTWQDFAHVQTSSTGTTYIPISPIAAGSTTVSAMQDGALTANTAIQGPIGDRLRIKYSVGSITSGLYTFQAFVLPD